MLLYVEIHSKIIIIHKTTRRKRVILQINELNLQLMPLNPSAAAESPLLLVRPPPAPSAAAESPLLPLRLLLPNPHCSRSVRRPLRLLAQYLIKKLNNKNKNKIIIIKNISKSFYFIIIILYIY